MNVIQYMNQAEINQQINKNYNQIYNFNQAQFITVNQLTNLLHITN